MCYICTKYGLKLRHLDDSLSVAPVDAVITDPNLSLDPFAGNTYRGKIIADQTKIKQQIDSGWNMASAADGIITFGFFEAQHAVGLYNSPKFGEGAGYSAFSEVQKSSARDSIGYWDDLIAAKFVEVSGKGASEVNKADILMANTTTGPAQAWAYYPYDLKQYKKLSSDAWFATPEANASNAWLRFGGYGDTTIIHELGHSLGLSHPGSYNFGPGFAVNYMNGAEYAQDSKQYSIMSYWSDRETNALVTNWNVFLAGQPQTPMIHDILTIQAKYGADLTTRVTDTVYGFNSNAGRDVFDFSKNPYPMLAIYDAGGNDTIDASGFTASQFIDLHAGSFSSIGGAVPTFAQVNAQRALWDADSGSKPGDPYYLGSVTQANYDALISSRPTAIAGRIAATTGVTGIVATEFKNVSIAFGSVIENAIGGSARDLLWGNEANNILRGNGGNDVLNGFEGADRLFGGAGNDTFEFSHLEKLDRIEDWNTGDRIDLTKLDAIAGTTGVNDAFSFIGSAGFSNVAGQLRYSNGVLEGDVNGDGIADFAVTLVGAPVLTAADILL
jgi:serralysin